MASKFKDYNGLISDEFLDTFGREFCKHQVLWKPNDVTNEFEIQTATFSAYQKLAQTLNLSVKAILKLLDTFPAACLDLMSRYEMLCRVDAGCTVPDWLTPLARHFKAHNSTKRHNSRVLSRHDLVRALWVSVRVGLGSPEHCEKLSEAGPGGGPTGPMGELTGPASGESETSPDVTEKGTEEETSPLCGPQAVSYFVARHHVTVEQVLPAWRCVVQLCVVKLLGALCAGDRGALVPAALRPAAAERALADLALLHDRVSQIEILTPAKLRALVLLFQLIVAATESYDDGERRRRKVSDDRDDRRDLSDPARDHTGDTRDEESANETNAIIDICDDPPETTNSDRRTGTKSASNGWSFTIVESSRYVEPCSTLREMVVESARRPRRGETVDLSDATAEESSDNELHTELDLEPDVHVVASDTSDYEMSNEDLNKYSKNKISTPSLLAENRNESSGNNRLETFDARSSEGEESEISSKSQNSDTRNDHPKRDWYENRKCNSSEEQKVVWALVYTEFKKRGRSASLISLQHRWVELLHRARVALLKAWSSDSFANRNIHPLLLMVAHRFPGIITESLPPWETLVLERQIVLESDIKDIINKYLENNNTLLNITENITFPDLLEEYVIKKDVHDPQCLSKNNTTCLIHNEKTSSIIDNIDKVLEQESQSQYSLINNELNVNSYISTVLDQIDPSKARVSIIFDEESDEDAKDDSSKNVREAASDLNNLHASNDSRGATALTEENIQIPSTLVKFKKVTEVDKKNIDNELEGKLNNMNNTFNPRSDLSVKNIITGFNQNIEDSTTLLTEDETVSYNHPDELSLLQPREPAIDEKLVNISRVVVTPIEHLPEWKKHSRNGVIKCRNFSVRNFTRLVKIDEISKKRLSKYAPRTNTNKNDSEENYLKREIRIKFEDDNFETDFGLDDDINNGIKYQKYVELYSMPDHLRKNRIMLTRKLKLSRTYFSLNFWCLDRNIESLKLCKPMTIKLNRELPRVAKRVELSDINEVRRRNRSILTAQVFPTVETTPPSTQRFIESQEAINTTRRTNNSLSSAWDGSELLQLLTNYAIRTNIPKSVPESATKDITTDSNLMDSIIDTMRLEDENNIQNSTITPSLNSLQPTPFPSTDPPQMLIESCNTNIDKNNSATDTFNTIQNCTEEVVNNRKLSSSNTSLAEATVGRIHISYNHIKESYMKQLQTMNYSSSTSWNPGQTDAPSAVDLRRMILHLVKHSDTKMNPENGMKLNRKSLNLHLRNFESQQRALIKEISKLTKILPQYFINMQQKKRVTKNKTAEKKRNKINQVKSTQSKDNCTLAGSSGDNSNDTDQNASSVFDDSEPNLVIDEESLQLSDNIDLNNSKINKTNNSTSIQGTFKVRKQEKQVKTSKKKSKQSTKTSEEDKPVVNEYQEWQRQKTMALKYFTLPMSDTSQLTSKDKAAQQPSTTNVKKNIQETYKVGKQDKKEKQIKRSKKKSKQSTEISEEDKPMANEYQEWQRQKTMALKYFTLPMSDTSQLTSKDKAAQQPSTTNVKKNIQETYKVGKQDKKEKQIKRSKKKSKQSTEISEEDKPMANEYQEWQRQKTMALKYFTLPMSDTSQLTSKDKAAQQPSTSTLTDQQSHGCQTNISMKRKNTEDLATTSTASNTKKRPKSHSNESDVVCISDSSSDDDVQITGCYDARDDTDKNNTNTASHTQPDTQQSVQTKDRNHIVIFTSPNQFVNQNVTNTPVAATTEPLYFIINNTQVPTATPEAINTTQHTETNNDPLVVKVLSNATTLLTLTQMVPQNNTQQAAVVSENEDSESLSPSSPTLRCQKTFNSVCKGFKCKSSKRSDDILTYPLNAIQKVTSQDSRNNEPSTFRVEKSNVIYREAITVKDYLSSNKQRPALIKVNGSKNLLFFCSRYIILTDVNIPSKDATYRTTFKINEYNFLSQVLVPKEKKNNILLLGPKGLSDYVYCECGTETTPICSLCHRLKINLPNPSNFLRINSDYYKKICSKPVKYVRLNKEELAANSLAVLEGNPDLMLINQMFFKLLTDSPPTYVRILSAIPDAASLRHLVRRQVGLYTFDVTQTQLVHAPLLYTLASRQVTVDHPDDKLVRVMQWFLN